MKGRAKYFIIFKDQVNPVNARSKKSMFATIHPYQNVIVECNKSSRGALQLGVGEHGSDWYKSYMVPLQKGFYPVRLEYFESEGNRHLDLIYLSLNTHETVNVTFGMMYFK